MLISRSGKADSIQKSAALVKLLQCDFVSSVDGYGTVRILCGPEPPLVTTTKPLMNSWTHGLMDSWSLMATFGL